MTVLGFLYHLLVLNPLVVIPVSKSKCFYHIFTWRQFILCQSWMSSKQQPEHPSGLQVMDSWDVCFRSVAYMFWDPASEPELSNQWIQWVLLVLNHASMNSILTLHTTQTKVSALFSISSTKNRHAERSVTFDISYGGTHTFGQQPFDHVPGPS